MRTRLRRGLSLIVSASMVVGLVPTPALAEMLEPVPKDEGGVIELVDADDVGVGSDETTSWEASDLTSESDALDESAEESAPSEPTALDMPAEVGVSAEASDQSVPAEEEQDVTDVDMVKGSLDGEDAVVLEAQGSVTSQQMSLGTSYTVNVEEDSYWLGSFTASEAATYEFYTEGSYDSYGHLYADQELTDELASDDDSAGKGNNFLIRFELEAGKTVYLKVREYSDGSMTCTVKVRKYDLNDIGMDIWSRAFASGSMFTYTGKAVVLPTLSIYRWDDDTGDKVTLTQGTDFKFDHFENADGMKLANSPTDIGDYVAVYVGMGNYYGETRMSFRVRNLNDISNDGVWDWSYPYTSTFDYTAKAVVLPELQVSRWDDDLGEQVTLTQGKDFRLAYVLNDDENLLDGMPVEDGYYTAVYEGISPYEGTIKAGFSIFDPKNLKHYEWEWVDEEDTVVMTGEPVTPPSICVYGWDENDSKVILVSGKDYKLAYYEDDEGHKLSGAPSEAGRYVAVYEGANGYHGSVATRFYVEWDEHNLAGGYLDLQSSVFDYTGSPIAPNVEVYASNWGYLSDSDYDLVYVDASGNESTNAPTDSGTYTVFARAVSGSAYYGQTPSVTVTIRAANDIAGSKYHLNLDKYNYAYTGSPIATPTAKIYYWDDDRIDLAQGTDFVFDHYEDDEGNRLSSAPAQIGDYSAVFAGTGSYSGRCADNFSICDPHDLSYASVRVASYEVPLTNGIAKPQVTVTDLAGKVLAEGTDYTLRYREYTDWDDDEGLPAEFDVITEPGEYTILVVSGTNSMYKNRTNGSIVTVYDPHDIGNNRWGGSFWPSEYLAYTGKDQKLPTPVIQQQSESDSNARTRLVEGKDFVFDHIVDDDGNNLGKGIPAAAGDYYAVYKGKGDYKGMISVWFCVYDARDISSSYWAAELANGSFFYTFGESVELGKLLIYNYNDKVKLVEGKDFVLDHFEDAYDNNLGTTAPSGSGTFYAVYKGKGQYTGTRRCWFRVSDSHDLATARLKLAQSKLPETNKPVALEVKVRDRDGILLERGKQYDLVYFAANGEQLDAAPSAKGTYAVAAKAKDGSVYLGMTNSVSFSIGEVSSEVPEPQVTATDLKLGKLVDATATHDSYWLGKFVAPKAGLYGFISTGTYDTYGYLYADAALGNLLRSDDDGGKDGNFNMSYYLAAGQTVYLKVRAYADFAITSKVGVVEYDASDLAHASIYTDKNAAQVVGNVVVPKITVIDALDNVLVEDTDYELSYYHYNNGEKEQVATITRPGEYYVVARAKANGSYKGSTSNCYFDVYGANDLSQADVDLSSRQIVHTGSAAVPAVVVTNAAGKTLVAGKDYTLVYYKNVRGGYEALSSAPSAIGSYAVAARAKTGGSYVGQTGAYSFDIYNPRDLSVTGNITPQDPAYYESFGYDDIPVYLYSGSTVTPVVSVRSDVEYLETSNYTITYGNNAGPTTDSSLAQVTVTGKAPYSGSKSVAFKIVDKLDLNETVFYNGASVSAFGESVGIYRSSECAPQFMGNGWAIDPQITIHSQYAPEQGKDYELSYTDEKGKAISAPSTEGKYHLVLTAKQGSVYSGTAVIPFALVATRDLEDHSAYPSLRDSYLYSYDTRWSDGRESYDIFDLIDDIKDLAFNLRVNGVELVENLDYVVSRAFDSILGVFTYTFTGMGSYDGTVLTSATVATDAKKSFGARPAGLGTWRSINVVYADANGVLQEPSLAMSGLTYGVDYTFGGFVDKDGKKVTTGKQDDVVYAVVKGLGTYAGAERKLYGKVEVSSAAADLGKRAFPTITNGIHVNNSQGGSWYLLKSQTPTVAVVVYQRSALRLVQGQGFTVQQSTSGSTMDLTLTANAGSPVTGTTKMAVNLVDTYALDLLAPTVILSDAANNTSWYHVGSSDAATLTYSGVDYMPQVSFGANATYVPDITYLLKNASGKTVNAVTGAGAYTFVIQGKGNWSGKISVSLTVRATSSTIDLNRCELSVGSNTALVNGVAKPTITLSCCGQALKQGADYTIEYGNNTTAGARAWFRATAKKGGKYSGVVKGNFTVGNPNAKVLKKTAYELRLQEPDRSAYYTATGTLRGYTIATGAKTGPSVMVVKTSDSIDATPLDPSYYAVEYGGLDKAGLGWVKVTGKNGFSGTLSANFYVIPRARTNIAKAKVTLNATSYTYNGKVKSPGVKSVTLNGTTLKANTDYKVTTVPIGRTNAGTYTYVVTGVGFYEGTAKASFTINKAANGIAATALKTPVSRLYSASAQSITASKLFKVSGASGSVSYAKKSGNAGITITSAGKVTIKKGLAVGTYACVFNVRAAGDANHNIATKQVGITFKIKKAKNPAVISAVARTAKLAQVKKKAVVVASPIKVKKAQGKATYAKVAKGSSAALSINKSTGKVTVKKGTKKGTYTIKVKVTVAGNKNYQSVAKTITCKVTVK